MTNQLKPWKSIDEQLEILQSRGLQIDNPDRARKYLGRLGYYRLSGYWYPFRQLLEQTDNVEFRSDQFIAGSHFDDLVKLYVFDKKLRLMALDALERIEMAVRVDIAHMLGQRDPLAHEKPQYFHGNFGKKISNKSGKTRHKQWLNKYQQQVIRSKRTPFVEHHLEKYGNLPIWVAIEVWDFGMLSTLFAGMTYADQQAIAEKYGFPSGKELASYLRSLNFIRNVSAHHARLWNVNVVERSPLPQDKPWRHLNNARPFFYFCLMQMFLRIICPTSSWASRLQILIENDFPKVDCGAVRIDDLGLDTDWLTWDLWSYK